MKLRIQDNSIRFGLTQPEVIWLKDRGLVEREVRFAPDRTLRYSVAVLLPSRMSQWNTRMTAFSLCCHAR
jgi:hypothetical protein